MGSKPIHGAHRITHPGDCYYLVGYVSSGLVSWFTAQHGDIRLVLGKIRIG